MSRSAKRPTFEDGMKRLDAIVSAMEAGEIGIEDSIAQYEEAMKLAAHCREILREAEQRIQKIQLDADGVPKTEPFDEGESDDERTS